MPQARLVEDAMPDPATLSHLSALARECLETAGAVEALDRAEADFRVRVRQAERLTLAAADEGIAAIFGTTLTELVDGELARRPR